MTGYMDVMSGCAALSLCGDSACHFRSWFDKLTTDGVSRFLFDQPPFVLILSLSKDRRTNVKCPQGVNALTRCRS